MRITHNDTKINNVLIDDKTGEGVCVIDLDTVMPGLVLYDFGDLARTTLSSSREDEPDLSRVDLDLNKFEAILRGFLTSVGKTFNETELEHLVFSALFMTLIIGCRFLTDYLLGDIYFKIEYPEHNLVRCRRQFKLAELIQENEVDLQRLVTKIRSDLSV